MHFRTIHTQCVGLAGVQKSICVREGAPSHAPGTQKEDPRHYQGQFLTFLQIRITVLVAKFWKVEGVLDIGKVSVSYFAQSHIFSAP